MWTSRLPASCRWYVEKASEKLAEERAAHPELPTGMERFRGLDYSYCSVTDRIWQGNQPIAGSHRLFATDGNGGTGPLTMALMVKQEGSKLLRLFRSLRKHVGAFVVLDTCSTDHTPQLITSVFHDIPGSVYRMPWCDFGTCRTTLMHLLDQHRFDKSLTPVTQWAILVDADYVLHDTVSDQPLVLDPKVDEYLLGTLESVEYWRPHIIRLSDRLKSYVCRTHEYLTDRLPWKRTERLQRMRIQHVGDGRFGARSVQSKHARDLLWLFMDLMDGFDEVRSFEYICRTALIEAGITKQKREYELSRWAAKEFMRLRDGAASLEHTYCISQQFASSFYQEGFTGDAVAPILSATLHGAGLVDYCRLEWIAELADHLNKINEFHLACSLSSFFTFNDRNPVKRGHNLFVNHPLHEVGFPTALCAASYHCRPYILLGLHLHSHELKSVFRSHDYSRNENLYRPIREGLETGRYLDMNLKRSECAALEAEREFARGQHSRGYDWMLSAASSFCHEDDLPPSARSGASRVWTDRREWTEQHPLYGYVNGLRTASEKHATQSRYCVRLFEMARTMSKSLWTRVAHLLDALKYDPSNREAMRLLLIQSERQSPSTCSAILKLARLVGKCAPDVHTPIATPPLSLEPAVPAVEWCGRRWKEYERKMSEVEYGEQPTRGLLGAKKTSHLSGPADFEFSSLPLLHLMAHLCEYNFFFSADATTKQFPADGVRKVAMESPVRRRETDGPERRSGNEFLAALPLFSHVRGLQRPLQPRESPVALL